MQIDGDNNTDTIRTESPGGCAPAAGSPAVMVMKIGKYPPRQAVDTAALLLRCYMESGIPCNAMNLFESRGGRRAFEIEDLFYALQAGLEAKRWEPEKARKSGDESLDRLRDYHKGVNARIRDLQKDLRDALAEEVAIARAMDAAGIRRSSFRFTKEQTASES